MISLSRKQLVGFAFLIGTGVAALVGCSSKKISIPVVTNLLGGSRTTLPPYEVKTLSNGLKIYYIHEDSLPRISLSLLVKSGSLLDPEEKLGLNAMVANLLDQGSNVKSAIQLADAFGEMGTEFSADPDSDFTSFSSSSLSTQSNQLLSLFFEVINQPAFADKEIEKVRSQVLSLLKKRVDNPSAFASRQAVRFLRADQGYGRDVLGTTETVSRIRKVDLIRFYLKNYRPNNSILAVTGRFDQGFISEVEKTFSAWEKKDTDQVVFRRTAALDKLQVRLVTKAGLAQTQIQFLTPGPTRAEEDYLALRLVGEAIGGGFASRLMARIRDDLGLTYSIYSVATAKKLEGTFMISTFTKNESVGRTVDEVLAVYNKVAQEGITQRELDMAKAQILGQFPRTMETADQAAGQLLSIDAMELPLTYLTKFERNIESVSLSQANAAIKRHLKPNALKVLIYGDKAKVLEQIKKYSPEVIPAEQLME